MNQEERGGQLFFGSPAAELYHLPGKRGLRWLARFRSRRATARLSSAQQALHRQVVRDTGFGQSRWPRRWWRP